MHHTSSGFSNICTCSPIKTETAGTYIQSLGNPLNATVFPEGLFNNLLSRANAK